MRLHELADRYRDNASAVVVEIDSTGRRREVTHRRLHDLAVLYAERLTAAGVRPGHVVGIRAANGIDWVLWDLAAMMSGAVLKAFADETVIGDPGEFVTRHGLALLVTDAEVPSGHPALVRPDGVPGVDVVPADAPRGEPGDLHSLVFSSGTSGLLKGLNVSRKGTEYVISRFIECFGVGAEDRHVIFLPLSNYQQRLSVYCCLWIGADVVLAPYQRIFGVVRDERPTFLIAPPVFYDTALQLFHKTGGDSLGDFLGGGIRFMITGMAPIRRETLEAYWAQGVRLLEAYGMTESGMIAWNTQEEHRLGSVGKLIDPEAVTFLPDGELLVHRPAPLSTGYFDTAGAADETYRPDGTIVTGDYGTLDDDGFLTLLGRKKDVIVLDSGRKVHPAEVESLFADVEGVVELLVVPTPRAGRLGAIVTPADPKDDALIFSIRERIEKINQSLESHRRITSLVFSDRPLRNDPRYMTANLKLSRPLAAAYFAEAAQAKRPEQPERAAEHGR